MASKGIQWLAPLLGATAPRLTGDSEESGSSPVTALMGSSFGALSDLVLTGMDDFTSGGKVVAAGVGAIMTQAFFLWMYTKWRDWYMLRSFFGHQLPIAEERASSQPDLKREDLLERITKILKNSVSATIISGAVGSGKTWLLSRAVRRLEDQGYGVVYLDVRPDSTQEEFVIQLANSIGFRFQRPTPWVSRVADWLFEQHWSTSDDSAKDEDMCDWQRITSAIERIAASAEHPPTLVIDNLHNLKVEEDERDFIGTILDWATWCAENEIMRVIVALPSIKRVKVLLDSIPRTTPAVRLFEMPYLTSDEVKDYLGPLLPMMIRNPVGEAQWKKCRKVAVLHRILESPMWCKKMWDMRQRLGLDWDSICASIQMDGARILRQFDLRSVEERDDPEDNMRRARVWRLLIRLSDTHEGNRTGCSYSRHMLGEAAEETVDALIEAGRLTMCLVTGELRIRSPPLRYIIRLMAGRNPNVTKHNDICPSPRKPGLESPDELLRREFYRQLDRLDGGMGRVWESHHAPRRKASADVRASASLECLDDDLAERGMTSVSPVGTGLAVPRVGFAAAAQDSSDDVCRKDKVRLHTVQWAPSHQKTTKKSKLVARSMTFVNMKRNVDPTIPTRSATTNTGGTSALCSPKLASVKSMVGARQEVPEEALSDQTSETQGVESLKEWTNYRFGSAASPRSNEDQQQQPTTSLGISKVENLFPLATPSAICLTPPDYQSLETRENSSHSKNSGSLGLYRTTSVQINSPPTPPRPNPTISRHLEALENSHSDSHRNLGAKNRLTTAGKKKRSSRSLLKRRSFQERGFTVQALNSALEDGSGGAATGDELAESGSYRGNSTELPQMRSGVVRFAAAEAIPTIYSEGSAGSPAPMGPQGRVGSPGRTGPPRFVLQPPSPNQHRQRRTEVNTP